MHTHRRTTPYAHSHTRYSLTFSLPAAFHHHSQPPHCTQLHFTHSPDPTHLALTRSHNHMYLFHTPYTLLTSLTVLSNKDLNPRTTAPDGVSPPLCDFQIALFARSRLVISMSPPQPVPSILFGDFHSLTWRLSGRSSSCI